MSELLFQAPDWQQHMIAALFSTVLRLSVPHRMCIYTTRACVWVIYLRRLAGGVASSLPAVRRAPSLWLFFANIPLTFFNFFLLVYEQITVNVALPSYTTRSTYIQPVTCADKSYGMGYTSLIQTISFMLQLPTYAKQPQGRR